MEEVEGEEPQQRRVTFAEIASCFSKLLHESEAQFEYPDIHRKCCDYPSLSRYCGEFQDHAWEGPGVYTFPHGVKYEGDTFMNEFHGEGALIYPNGQRLEGTWNNGKLIKWSYSFKDQHSTSLVEPWPYCQFPNRTFEISKEKGLQSPDNERLTATDPPRTVPPNCYDTSLGFYDLRLKAIWDADDGTIIRVPSADETEWILTSCRRPEPIPPVGYRPDLYEFWTNGTKSSTLKIMHYLEEELRGEDGMYMSNKEFPMSDSNKEMKT